MRAFFVLRNEQLRFSSGFILGLRGERRRLAEKEILKHLFGLSVLNLLHDFHSNFPINASRKTFHPFIRGRVKVESQYFDKNSRFKKNLRDTRNFYTEIRIEIMLNVKQELLLSLCINEQDEKWNKQKSVQTKKLQQIWNKTFKFPMQ